MSSPDTNNERQQIEQAITAQESLRGTVDDSVIDASIATLKEKLATILFMDIAAQLSLSEGSGWGF